MLAIKPFLEQVRKPKHNISLSKQIAATAGIILVGFALGVLQKQMDGAPVNAFFELMQQFDVGNYFGRLAIWILLATMISVYASSPLRAAINTFSFFYRHVGRVLSLLQLCFRLLTESLYDDVGSDCFCILLYGIYLLVCQRRRFRCDNHIKYDYRCSTCTSY